MEITISGRHFEVTDAIRQYALDKVSKLPRYFNRILEIEVRIDKPANHNNEVEVIADVEQHDDFIAREKGDDVYACIDQVTDKMERQLTDHKERLRNRKHSAR